MVKVLFRLDEQLSITKEAARVTKARRNVVLYPEDAVTCPDTIEPTSKPALVMLLLTPIKVPLLPF